ncbi:hypothetical protein LEM8419_03584 [Neolewinella maritima]|uniref:UVR domain-containing protein n=1 Tax=Neolewinella maritima TaxID=1383882 RepID=A0ABN8F6X9_9BACT|nr:UvrB/UvrC motif-containing protein [Neolewinella maritima]CAH1002712.1 hypothetical protein LEM8419_03584 [Neolewinella maritima]
MRTPILALAALGAVALASVTFHAAADQYYAWRYAPERRKGEDSDWDHGHVPTIVIGDVPDELLAIMGFGQPQRNAYPTKREQLELEKAEALEEEDYERAAELRDEIKKLK